MCLGPDGEAEGLTRAFVWRNIREDCLRKGDVNRITIDSSIWTIGAWIVSWKLPKGHGLSQGLCVVIDDACLWLVADGD